jgi:hypothetical protein
VPSYTHQYTPTLHNASSLPIDYNLISDTITTLPSQEKAMTKPATETDEAEDNDSSSNYDILKDCLSTLIIEKLSPQNTRPAKKRSSKGRKNEIKPVEQAPPTEAEVENDVAELGEFTEVSPFLIFLGGLGKGFG